MSCYVVDRDHIRFLVCAAERMCRFEFFYRSPAQDKWLRLGKDISPDEFGQMLWDENVRSVVARYPDCKAEDGTLLYDRMPGSTEEVYLYQHPAALGWDHIDPVVVLKACACYAYQACEHDGWKESDAYSAIRSLECEAIGRLPGYSTANWGAPTSEAVSVFNL